MKLEFIHEYTTSSRETYDLFCSDGFHKNKFKACGARKIKVIESDKSDDEFTITVEREVPADVPGVLKSLVGEWNKITQVENWEDTGDDEFVCDYRVMTDGVPVDIVGTMSLMPSKEGCTNHIELEINCSVPLLGKKLAQFVAKDAEKSLDDEFDFISDALA